MVQALKPLLVTGSYLEQFFQVWHRQDRVHEAAAFQPPQVQLLPLHDPGLRPNRQPGRDREDLVSGVH